MNCTWRELDASIDYWRPPTCVWLAAPVYSSGVVSVSIRYLATFALLPWRLLKGICLIHRLIVTKNIRIIHVNSLVLFPIALALRLFCRRKGIRVIWHLREVLNEKLLWPFRLMITKTIELSSDAIIAITSNEAKPFARSDKVQVIHNTIPEHWLSNVESIVHTEDAAVVVAMGCYFSAGKGTADFIQMAKMLGTRYPDVRFELYTGRPPSLGALDELALATSCSLSECVLNAQVRLLFDRQLTFREYARFSIYVRADQSGCPWGRDIIEAMCCEVPVVATGSSQEFVVNGKTGFLVPPRTPELLAEAVERLLLDKDLRAAMGQAARERAVELFSPEVHRQGILRAFGVESSDQGVTEAGSAVCRECQAR
jgi:glycosyltransferase involved in cell wall biosynthesis